VRHVETQDLLDQFGAKAQVGADRDARPWETVGGVGFGGGGGGSGGGGAPKAAYAKPKGRAGGRRLFTAAGCEQAYAKPKGRPDLTSQSEGAREAAEGFNDQAVKAFKAKDWQRCYDLSSEAIRLNPRKTAYLGRSRIRLTGRVN